MANTIHVDVVSAEEQIFSGEAEFVVLPGEAGELGVYPRHTPLMTRLKAGAVRIQLEGGVEELVFVAGGILEVQPQVVTVLADTAIRGADLDEAQAQEAQRRAEEAMQNAKSDVDLARAEAEFAAMAAQIAAIRKLQEGNFWWLTAHEALSFVSCRTSQATETATRQVSFQQRSGNACSR